MSQQWQMSENSKFIEGTQLNYSTGPWLWLLRPFALEGAADIGLGTVDIGPDDIDPPEHLTDGRFDLGELAAEYLALSLDPYPRAGETDSESSALSEFAPGNADEEEKPFAVLRDWRKKSDGESGGESG